MIRSFRHKGLLRFFQTGNTSGIQSVHAKRVQMILAALDTASAIEDLRTPRLRLHPLKGSAHGRWSVWVNGNWRITFEFYESHADVLDYEDYH